MKSLSLKRLISQNLFSLGLVAFIFYAILIVLSAYDLEDKILISMLTVEAQTASTSLTIEAYNQTTSTNFSLHEISILPSYMQDAFNDSDRAIREFLTPDGRPIHAKRMRLASGIDAVLVFQTQFYTQATDHIVDIVQYILFGAVLIIAVAIYFQRRITTYIVAPISNFSDFVSSNRALTTYEAENNKVSISELGGLINGYNLSIQHQLDSILREKQLNQDISHELRTPLTVFFGALDVIKLTQSEAHKQEAVNRLCRVAREMQALVNGVLWLAKDDNEARIGFYSCKTESILLDMKDTSAEIMQIPSKNIHLNIKDSFTAPVPAEVLQVVLRNLVANALTYSDNNQVILASSDNTITVSDTGSSGDFEKPIGFGVGLTIVQRLCDKFGIVVDVKTMSAGTNVTLQFANISKN